MHLITKNKHENIEIKIPQNTFVKTYKRISNEHNKELNQKTVIHTWTYLESNNIIIITYKLKFINSVEFLTISL